MVSALGAAVVVGFSAGFAWSLVRPKPVSARPKD
jgi:hypothetical protein